MPQEDLPQNVQGCSCSEWEQNIQRLDSLLLFGFTHGREYQGTPFRFCPWCGRLLPGITGKRDEALWQKCRQRIKQDFFATDEWGTPQGPNMLVAARPVTDYQQATGDILGTLELMLTFVEAGTQFTDQYGDMDEPFYEGLELMLEDFRDLLLANPDLYKQGNLAQRLTTLREHAGWMGWGYGDYVTEQVTKIRQRVGDA